MRNIYTNQKNISRTFDKYDELEVTIVIWTKYLTYTQLNSERHRKIKKINKDSQICNILRQ